MIKHVGRHNNRKIVLVFRKLPEPQTHMALVLYTDTIPANYHDDLMQVLESDIGQKSKDFADALHRNMFSDGRYMLETLHYNQWLKKVPTNQVIIEANAKSTVRLDELNNIIDKIESGEDAARELKELDDNAGIVIRNRTQQREPVKTSSGDIMGETLNETVSQPSEMHQEAPSATEPALMPYVADNQPMPNSGVLSDKDIAESNLKQASQFEAQIESLTKEIERLREEAYEMAPDLKPKKKGPGRPPKAKKE